MDKDIYETFIIIECKADDYIRDFSELFRPANDFKIYTD